MLKFIAQSSAEHPLGIPPGRKCLVVPQGIHAGRAAILYASSATTIKLVAADPPYTSFTTPIDIATGAADTPFDATMTSDGNIYVAYITGSGNDLAFVKLTFSGGAWTVGSGVTVYNADDCSYPAICKLTTGQLWIIYTRLSGSTSYISGKMSLNDGVGWGTVSDPGDTLSSGGSSAYGVMVEMNLYQYLFFTDGGSRLAWRVKPNGGIVWGSETTLVSGSGFDDRFAAAVSPDGRIGVVYMCTGGLKFREYMGSSWSGEIVIDESGGYNPTVAYRSGEPFVLYARDRGDALRELMSCRRDGTVFTSPAPLDTRKTDVSRLLAYHAASGSYQDKTAQAASTAAGDIFHTTSGVMLAGADDALFVGLNEPFSALRLVLSTAGAGGEVIWKYWDGQGWKVVAPVSGNWHFSSLEQDVLLWNDYTSIPSDWQKRTISGHTCYWLAVAVTSAFTTAPVGSRISAITRLKAFSLQR